MNEQQSTSGNDNDCEIVEELLSGFYDEELNEKADAFVRHHLDRCAQCAAKLDELKATVGAINELPREATPEHDLWSGIVERSQRSSPIPLRNHRKRRRRFSMPTLLAATLAALMLPTGILVVGSRILGAREAENEPVLPPGASDELEGIIADEMERAMSQEMERVMEEAARIRQMTDTVLVFREEQRRTPEQERAIAAELTAMMQAMMQALKDKDAEIRRTAAAALGEFQDDRAIGALVGALDDEDAEVRRWAAWALGEIGTAHQDAFGGLSYLVEHDPVAEVRRWAAWALGEIGEPPPVPALMRALANDNNLEVRRWSAWALGEIQSPEAVNVLVRALDDDPAIEPRRWSAWALGEIQSPAAVEGLVEALLGDPAAEVRRWSAWALGEIQSPAATPALAQALVTDGSPEVRRWSAWSLGEIGDRRGVEALTEATRDGNPDVRIAAIRALGEIGN